MAPPILTPILSQRKWQDTAPLLFSTAFLSSKSRIFSLSITVPKSFSSLTINNLLQVKPSCLIQWHISTVCLTEYTYLVIEVKYVLLSIFTCIIIFITPSNGKKVLQKNNWYTHEKNQEISFMLLHPYGIFFFLAWTEYWCSHTTVCVRVCVHFCRHTYTKAP